MLGTGLCHPNKLFSGLSCVNANIRGFVDWHRKESNTLNLVFLRRTVSSDFFFFLRGEYFTFPSFLRFLGGKKRQNFWLKKSPYHETEAICEAELMTEQMPLKLFLNFFFSLCNCGVIWPNFGACVMQMHKEAKMNLPGNLSTVIPELWLSEQLHIIPKCLPMI